MDDRSSGRVPFAVCVLGIGLSIGTYLNARNKRYRMKRKPPIPKEIEIYRNDVKIKYYATHTKGGGGGRGEVVRLSNASLKRLAFVANNTHVDLDVMLTLTYPSRWPASGKECKRHLNAMLQWIRRRVDPFSYLWFLEFQRRGAPHFHLMYASRGVRLDAAEVGGRWASICDMGDENHAAAGTRIEKIRNKNGAGRYCAKYASKAEQKEPPTQFRDVGRFWGHSRDLVPKPLATRRVRGIYEVSGLLDGWEHAPVAVWRGYGTCYNAAAQVRDNMGLTTNGKT